MTHELCGLTVRALGLRLSELRAQCAMSSHSWIAPSIASYAACNLSNFLRTLARAEPLALFARGPPFLAFRFPKERGGGLSAPSETASPLKTRA